MPLNTVLAAPPLEANEMALNVFEENELQIGPEEELVSDDEEEIARKAALKREREIKNEKERERKRRIKVYSFKTKNYFPINYKTIHVLFIIKL